MLPAPLTVLMTSDCLGVKTEQIKVIEQCVVEFWRLTVHGQGIIRLGPDRGLSPSHCALIWLFLCTDFPCIWLWLSVLLE